MSQANRRLTRDAMWARQAKRQRRRQRKTTSRSPQRRQGPPPIPMWPGAALARDNRPPANRNPAAPTQEGFIRRMLSRVLD